MPPPESVWDDPRPPRVERSAAEVVVVLGGVEVCRTTRALRVLETSHPPSWYLPADDWLPERCSPPPAPPSARSGGGRPTSTSPAAAWTYLDPSPGFEVLRGTVAPYPGRMDRCTVGGEVVRPQEDGFYGGCDACRENGRRRRRAVQGTAGHARLVRPQRDPTAAATTSRSASSKRRRENRSAWATSGAPGQSA